MAAETIGKVFDPFFTTKEVGKGTGLGLSMVYGFVKQSGGDVEIRSTPGVGTSIMLSFPRLVSGSSDAQISSASQTSPDTGLETILVVEDDDDVRAHTVDLLRELGYRVLEAYDGESALRLLARPDQDVQLILTDVVMPSMSGWELADAARGIFPGMRILFTSGYPRDAILKNGKLEAGCRPVAEAVQLCRAFQADPHATRRVAQPSGGFSTTEKVAIVRGGQSREDLSAYRGDHARHPGLCAEQCEWRCSRHGVTSGAARPPGHAV